MTSQGGPGHAANDAGRDDRTLPLRPSPRLNRCHPQKVPVAVATRRTCMRWKRVLLAHPGHAEAGEQEGSAGARAVEVCRSATSLRWPTGGGRSVRSTLCTAPTRHPYVVGDPTVVREMPPVMLHRRTGCRLTTGACICGWATNPGSVSGRVAAGWTPQATER